MTEPLEVMNCEQWEIDKLMAFVKWLHDDKGVVFTRDTILDGEEMAHLIWEYVLQMPWSEIEAGMQEVDRRGLAGQRGRSIGA